jgi:NADH-quinone oxidoreductase subunit B
MSAASSRFDLARFASEFFRFTPRSADLLLVMGTITYKQAPILRRIWEQMAEPKWVIAVGACACSGGFYDCYCTVPGIDEIVPVDVYIAGCPPRPEGYMEALMLLQEKIKDESYMEQRRQGLHQKVYIG